MTEPKEHTRRDFLRGKAAVKTLATKAQAWVDSTSELLGTHMSQGPVTHLHASRRAMACEFAVQYHQPESDASNNINEEVLAAFDEIESIEDQLTIYRDQSEVLEINQQANDHSVEVDGELYGLLQLCEQLFRETGGAFDITSGPLSRAWGFLQRQGRLPTREEIEAARKHVGGENVELDAEARTIHLRHPKTEINFNAIGKGHALDRADALLKESGHNDYLWHGGGSSVLARGENRASKSRGWTLGLRHPLQPERRLVEFHLRDRALATAGGATQFFEHEGRRYSHILDPRTGWPAEGVFTSTVLAPSAALADGLATAFFVMEPEQVEQFCAKHPEIGVLLVYITNRESGFEVKSIGLLEEECTRLE